MVIRVAAHDHDQIAPQTERVADFCYPILSRALALGHIGEKRRAVHVTGCTRLYLGSDDGAIQGAIGWS
jgi:hypothetical protein